MTLPTGNRRSADSSMRGGRARLCRALTFSRRKYLGSTGVSPYPTQKVSRFTTISADTDRLQISTRSYHASHAYRPTQPASFRSAFTLIELILVMAMLLIVLGVAFPSLKGFFQGRNIDSEARRFLSLTRYGQSR